MKHWALCLLLSLPAVLAGCASTGRDEIANAREPSASAAQDWDLAGWRVIGCCCPAPCPCRINKKPMYCHGCDHTDIVHVERGTLGGTKMDGVTWVVVGRVFGKDPSKNWTYVYVDEKADEAQVKALGDWLGGVVAATGAKAPHLAGTFAGMREVPMTVTASAKKREYGCTIPGILELETRAIVAPGHAEPVMSTGILDSFGDRFVHSDTLVHKYDDRTIGYSWDLTGRQSNQAEFVLTPALAEKGHFGWGCWSAHEDLGDSEPYGEELRAHGGS